MARSIGFRCISLVGQLPNGLVLHLLYPTIVSEIFLYNLIPIASIIGISVAPHISDRFAKPGVASAVLFWAVASTVGSIAIFYSTSTTSSFVSNLFYLLFYLFFISLILINFSILFYPLVFFLLLGTLPF